LADDQSHLSAYLEQNLRPTPKRGDIVIIDNLSAHKGVAVEQRHQNCACAAMPTQSPDPKERSKCLAYVG